MSRFFSSIVYSLSIIFLGVIPSASAQYELHIKNSEEKVDTLIFGYFFGTRQYAIDTVTKENNHFLIEGNDTLDSGMYFLLDKASNSVAHILIDKDAKLSFELAYHPSVVAKFKNSPDNQIFYKYVAFLNAKKDIVAKIREDIKNGEVTEEEGKKQINEIDREVKDYQSQLIKGNPDMLVTIVMKAGMDIKVPDFGEGEEAKTKKYKYYKKHFFDQVDFTDDRMIRTSILGPKVEQYFEQMVLSIPDSIIVEIDNMLSQMDYKSDMYRFFSSYFISKYANSSLIGMDKVYVHVVENYFDSIKTPWVPKEELLRIHSEAESMKPTLIGKKAPNFTMMNEAGEKISLYDIESQYTILLFWDPDCSYCKKEIPEVENFMEEYKGDEIKIVTVCSKFQSEVPKCWEYINKKEIMKSWTNVVDPLHKSRYKINYNLKSLPRIYILDAEKKILFKQLKASNLSEYFKFLDKNKANTEQ